MESTARRIRSVNITPIETTIRHGSDGVVYLSSPQALGPYPDRITDRLEHWAREAPGRVFLAQRDLTGGWRTLTYADAFDSVGRISQSLLNRKLSPERPILILSGNGIDHALLALAAMHVGVPYAPIAPAYALQARDYGTLQQIFHRLKPGLVFAAEGAAFERALSQVLPAGVELVVSSSSPATLASTPFSELLATSGTGIGQRGKESRRPRHHRKDPVHLGIHRESEGCHQHTADALLESGNDSNRDGVPRGRAANALLLAAVEPHRRRQPQLRHRALQRRHVLYRRRQADAGTLRRDAAQPA